MIGVKFCWAEYPIENRNVKAKCIAYIRNSKNGYTLYAGAVYKGKHSELKSYRKSLRFTALHRLINRPIFSITPFDDIDITKYKRFIKKLPNQQNKFHTDNAKKTQIIQNFLLTYEAEHIGLKSNKNLIEISKSKIANEEGNINVELGNKLQDGVITPISQSFSTYSNITDMIKNSSIKIPSKTNEFEDVSEEYNIITALSLPQEKLNKIGISYVLEKPKYYTREFNNTTLQYPKNLTRLPQPALTRTIWMQLSNKKLACIVYDYTPSINLLIYTGCIGPYHPNISRVEKTRMYNIAVGRYYKKPVIIETETHDFIKELGRAIALYGVKNYIQEFTERKMSPFKRTLYTIASPVINFLEYFLY